MFKSIDPSLFPVLKTRRALIVVDAQNDFLSPEGNLHIDTPHDLTGRIVKLVKGFRPFGDIVWIRSEYGQPRLAKSEQIITSDAPAESSRLSSTPRGRRNPASAGLEPPSRCPEAFLSGSAPNRPECVRKDTDGFRYPTAIQELVEKKDMSFVKSHYSGFQDPNLIQKLRMKFVSEVFVCGSLTNMGVMATAIDAGSHGLDIGIVEDCCGYRDRERHNGALTQIKKMIGCEVLSTDKILDRLKPKPRVQPIAAPIPNPRGRRYPSIYEATSRGSSEKPETKESATSTVTSKLDYSSSKESPADEVEDSLPPIVFTRARVAVRGHPMRSLPVQGGMNASPNDDLNGESGDESRSEGSTKALIAAQAPTVATTITKGKVPEEPTGIADGASSSKEGDVETALKNLSLEDRKWKHSTNLPESSSNDHGSPRRATESIKAVIGSAQTKNGSSPGKNEDTGESTTINQHNTSAAESEALCEGDTKVLYNVLSQPLFHDIFNKVSNEVDWKRMSHQGGDVPRLVAVQGEVDNEGNIPVYRHPADETPPLHTWTSTVEEIKKVVEEKVGHPLNHALIQFYRDGSDYISEHSDKTLDIVRGSFIVNVSLGAERTLTLRTKRQPKQRENDQSVLAAEGARREVQRALLPHNSMCKMGLQTNMRWLHAIRQDKRLDRDKTEQELAYGGARISLTFRQIGTFLDRNQKIIWGQGATAKTKGEAHGIINGQSPEAIQMIKAFGRENQSTDFDWDEYYGHGFDVLHISSAPRLFTSSDQVANMRVQLMLAELAVGHAKGSSAPVSTSRNAPSERGSSGDPLIKLVDNDEARSTVLGDIAIMLYLDRYYATDNAKLAARKDVAISMTRFQEALVLGERKLALGHVNLGKFLDPWEAYLAGGADFISGSSSIGIADFAFWPVLYDIVEGDRWSLPSHPNLKAYFGRIRDRDTVIKVFGKDKESRVQEATKRPTRDSVPLGQEGSRRSVAPDYLECEELGKQLVGTKSSQRTLNQGKSAAKRGLDSDV